MEFWEWIEKEKKNCEFLRKKSSTDAVRRKSLKKYFNRRIAAILGVHFPESGLYEEQFYKNNWDGGYGFFDRDKFDSLVKKIKEQEKDIEKRQQELQLLRKKDLSDIYNQDQVDKSEARLWQKLIDHYNTGKKIENECFFSDAPKGKLYLTEADKEFFKMLLDLQGRQKIEWMNRNQWEKFSIEEREKILRVTKKILNEDERWTYQTLGGWRGDSDESIEEKLEKKLKFPELYRMKLKLLDLINEIECYMNKYKEYEISVIDEEFRAYGDITKKIEKSLDKCMKQWEKVGEIKKPDIKYRNRAELINALIMGDLPEIDVTKFPVLDMDAVYDKAWNPKNDQEIDNKKYEEYKNWINMIIGIIKVKIDNKWM